jgi:hypothetical protein
LHDFLDSLFLLSVRCPNLFLSGRPIHHRLIDLKAFCTYHGRALRR